MCLCVQLSESSLTLTTTSRPTRNITAQGRQNIFVQQHEPAGHSLSQRSSWICDRQQSHVTNTTGVTVLFSCLNLQPPPHLPKLSRSHKAARWAGNPDLPPADTTFAFCSERGRGSMGPVILLCLRQTIDATASLLGETFYKTVYLPLIYVSATKGCKCLDFSKKYLSEQTTLNAAMFHFRNNSCACAVTKSRLEGPSQDQFCFEF